jgi:hypothetical protein
MTALTQDVVADLRRRVDELEQRLQSSLDERDEAIAQQAATAVENTRLLTEFRTTRDRQAGSAEILRAIAGASGDAKQSLQRSPRPPPACSALRASRSISPAITNGFG